MRKLLMILAAMACLNGNAYKLRLDGPTLESSCASCDSAKVTPWGDGTSRFVVGLQGAGYDPRAFVRVTWLRSDGVVFAFEFEPGLDGSWACVWTDLPVGDYTVSASQQVSRFRFVTVNTAAVNIY